MNPRTHKRASRLSFALGIAMLVGSAMGARVADASGSALANSTVDIAAPARVQTASGTSTQITGNQISSADLGLAPQFVSRNATVHLPNGEVARFTGPAGVDAFIATLNADFPGVAFSITEFTSIGNLLVFDWQGTQDGAVVVPGRTLATVENGAIKEIRFLNLNNAAPVEGGFSAIGSTPVSTGFFVIVDEKGNTLIPERIVDNAILAAAIEAQAWPDLDPSSLADRARKIKAAGLEAQSWPDLDPSSLADRAREIDAAGREAQSWPDLDPSSLP